MIPVDFSKVETSKERGGTSWMLVVTRKKDEKLIIGNEIEIQVLRIGRDNVRLGIKAPTHISIYRYEIYEAIKQENVSAVQSQILDKDTMETLKGVLKGDSVLKADSTQE
jgi:carbon storage regulator